jgi:GrpB-like predicted nucleotidyltransferase (UPF0157 family)
VVNVYRSRGLSASCQTGEVEEGIVVVQYDPQWPRMFTEIGTLLRRELADIALRIDHVGSTAVHDLDAKPIIDIQISVAALEPIDAYRTSIERAGFVYRANNPELTKRYFRELPGDRRTHIHVRRAGSFSEQFALLFRDYLRTHREQAARYAALKHSLAAQFARPGQRLQYVEAKVPFTWETMHLADDWAQATGWEPGMSDC